MKKRLLSILLSFVLVATLLPVSVFANESVSETSQIYDLSKGSITVKVDTVGKQTVSQPDNPDSPITDGEQTGKTVITQKDSSTTTTSNTITIEAAEGQTAEVTLSGVNIDVSSESKAALSTSDKGDVTVKLYGSNTLKSGNYHAGLEKNNSGKLTISGTDVVKDVLNATGGLWSAGIGGNDANKNVSNITISCCKINATGEFAAGIGGGNYGSGSNIIISDSTVTATGKGEGAGIGGGYGSSGSNIWCIRS